jgi:glycosyltransferase involved in cell wall biosynthesis
VGAGVSGVAETRRVLGAANVAAGDGEGAEARVAAADEGATTRDGGTSAVQRGVVTATGASAGMGVGPAAACRLAHAASATSSSTIERRRNMHATFSLSLRVPLARRRKRNVMEQRPLLSIVVPFYNEEGNVAPLFERLEPILASLPGTPAYEVVAVNDGSSDATLERLRDEIRARKGVVVVNLSRNFGHQLAATAGIDAASGDAVILMDGDLQDPPELIEQFVERWRDGYDVVYAVRRSRKGESLFKVLTARFFYRLVRMLTKVDIPLDTGDFRLMSRRVVQALQRSPERHRFLRGMVSWVGFRQTGVSYDRDERHSGVTKYPLGKMIRFAIDGITSFSDAPLRLASYLGFFSSVVAFVYALYVIASKLANVNPLGYTPGWASTIVAVLFLGGVQLIGIGILGEYLGRIYDEVKGRPIYLISDIERS